MLFADVMECSHDTAFKQREKSFNAVGRHNPFPFVTNIFFGAVFNDMVVELWFKAAIAVIIIRVHVRTNSHIFPDNLFQIRASDMAHDLAANTATTLKQRNNGRFIFQAAAPVCLAADIRFVHFNRAREFVFEQRVFKSKTNPVRHEQRRAITANLQLTLQLQ